MAFIITKYIHFISILVLFSCCLLEYVQLQPSMKRSKIKRLLQTDILFGLSALVVLLSGLAMALWLAKPLGYYLSNWFFHLKYTLFILIGLISAYPTLFFFRNRRGDDADNIELPNRLRQIIQIELAGILCLPLLGILMASGFGAIR
ncbi:MAG: DUF2214 family protein [Sedimenticola sp.]|nr:DUF2214 family protein [Sedimenticola sp.]